MSDLVGRIMDFESGELDADGTLKLFSELVKSGIVWGLQGHYGRAASSLIERGYLDKDGKILREVAE